MRVDASEPFEILRTALETVGARYAVGGSWASTAYSEARFTPGIDMLVDFQLGNLERFLAILPGIFYRDADHARESLQTGRPFNLIYMPTALKFDLFPARAFPLGLEELSRAVLLPNSGLSAEPIPFVSAEDILLAKLHWFREGGEVSEKQWRDIRGIVRSRSNDLDRAYLQRGSQVLGVSGLLDRALEPDSQDVGKV